MASLHRKTCALCHQKQRCDSLYIDPTSRFHTTSTQRRHSAPISERQFADAFETFDKICKVPHARVQLSQHHRSARERDPTVRARFRRNPVRRVTNRGMPPRRRRIVAHTYGNSLCVPVTDVGCCHLSPRLTPARLADGLPASAAGTEAIRASRGVAGGGDGTHARVGPQRRFLPPRRGLSPRWGSRRPGTIDPLLRPADLRRRAAGLGRAR